MRILGPDYDTIFAAIRSHETLITFELYEKLLDYEIFLMHEESKRTTLISAPVAQINNQAPSRNNITEKRQVIPHKVSNDGV